MATSGNITLAPTKHTAHLECNWKNNCLSPHSALVAEAQKRLSAHTALSGKMEILFQFIYCPTWSGDFLAKPHTLYKKTWLAGKYVALRRLKIVEQKQKVWILFLSALWAWNASVKFTQPPESVNYNHIMNFPLAASVGLKLHCSLDWT
jgi:hypothetical protein